MLKVCKGLQIIIKINIFCRTSVYYIPQRRQDIVLDPTLRYTWSILELKPYLRIYLKHPTTRTLSPGLPEASYNLNPISGFTWSILQLEPYLRV